MASVLIVDDSGFQRSIIRKHMEDDGHNVEEAVNGLDALEKIKIKVPDIMLLDILMPGLDGTQVLQELAKLGLKFPVIVVSADIQETVQKQCMNLGAVGFVNKPVKGESLKALRAMMKAYIG